MLLLPRALAFVLLATATVHADDHLLWEAGLGLEAGGGQIATRDGTVRGLRLEGGLRFERLALIGSYSLLGLADGSCTGTQTQCRALLPVPPGDGLEQRFGLDARLSVYRGVYLEGGVGKQRLDWRTTQVWRNDIGLGIGVSTTERDQAHHGTLSIGARVTLARDPGDAMGRVEPTVMIAVGALLGN